MNDYKPKTKKVQNSARAETVIATSKAIETTRYFANTIL